MKLTGVESYLVYRMQVARAGGATRAPDSNHLRALAGAERDPHNGCLTTKFRL